MPRRYYSSTAVATTLTGSITNATTSIPVAATTGFPGTTPFTLIFDEGTASEEVVTITNVSGLNLTATRGQDGTSAVSHSAGATVKHGVSARDFDEPNAFLNAGGTVGGNTTISGTIAATGLAGSLLSATNGAALGTAGPGTATVPARADHVHSPNSTSATLTTPILSGTVDNSSGTVQAGTLDRNILNTPMENANVSATASTGTINVETDTAAVWYYTTNASANFTLNFRAASGTTMNTRLAVNDSISAVFLCTNGATPYYPTVFQVDGSAVTPKWSGGTAPTAGNANSIDAYSFTIIKTAATPTYVVLASAGRYA